MTVAAGAPGYPRLGARERGQYELDRSARGIFIDQTHDHFQSRGDGGRRGGGVIAAMTGQSIGQSNRGAEIPRGPCSKKKRRPEAPLKRKSGSISQAEALR